MQVAAWTHWESSASGLWVTFETSHMQGLEVQVADSSSVFTPNVIQPGSMILSPPLHRGTDAGNHGAADRSCLGTWGRRGKKLTLAQENVLRRLYELESPSIPEGQIPVKKFWVYLATRFQQCTGREYSWLSVRRKIMGSGPDAQLPIPDGPSSCVEQTSNEQSAIEPALDDSSGSTVHGLNSADESRSTLEQGQTPSNSHCVDRLGSSGRERSPSVFGDRTRRALFPDAAKHTKQTRNTAKIPRHPRKRHDAPASNRRNNLAAQRLDHPRLPTASRGVLPGPTNSPSLPRTFGDRHSTKPGTLKRKRLVVDGDPPNEMSKETANVLRRSHEAVSEDSDTLYPSDPDELPNTPTKISRRVR
ncbi:hypothetical protein N7541_004871 [Penicillium brevicompactum]|uniref:Uncharacterized protein n=1 Tax=Penicillium brevicompactum TaxID=5074 RepID=A0A9W9UU94_PENBR|nr:hypothetical protein N7541_004871 [Penicillium brevicompactum]